MNAREPYRMSFTTGTLLYRECVLIGEVFARSRDWDATRDAVIGDNLLQMRTQNALKRIYREASARLRCLTEDQQRLLQAGARPEQNYLLWLAACKRYRFIYDFAVEVVHEKFLRLDLTLTYTDYDLFFYDRSEWHPEVARVAQATQAKQRQVVFKMLREAELLTEAHQIVPALLTPQLAQVIAADDPVHFVVFPVSDLDVRSWLG